MKRRQFLKLAGASTSCSVFVNATVLSAEAASPATPPTNASAPIAARFEGEPNMSLTDLACDIFIAGGGMAGVCAAIASARHGAKVILVQDRSRLGGNSSSEVKMHIVGADMHGARPGWRESGLIEEFRLDDAVANPHRSREMWDLLLYDKVKSEPNITLLVDTVLCAAEVKADHIQRVLARSDKTESLFRIKASIYADCTGDCRLGLETGAKMRSGRESKAEFQETLAQDKPDGHTLGSTILFTARDYGKPIAYQPPKWARKVTKDMLRFRQIKSWEYGYWWIEWGGDVDIIRDNERIRFELLAITLGVWDYVKNSGEHPSSANWAMDWLSMVPGKRGSRRIDGDHILTEHDLMGENGDFADALCIGGWSMDDHPPGGFDRSDLRPARQIPPPFPYNIPLRSLYSRNITNLMMAGRNISASHVAFTSARVMATCSVIGQAMGTAAVYCVQNKLLPRQLASDKSRVEELQQILLRDDQTIRHRKNTDALDLARTAEVVASGSVADSDPANIINGFVRDLPGKWENRWGHEMRPEGVFIELQWKAPQSIRHIQITFDTGFQRQLTLSQQDSVNATVIRAPQPETVRDYELLYLAPDSKNWVSFLSIAGNYQRLRRHDFKPFNASALRLKITATNGSKEARIYEIRCYA